MYQQQQTPVASGDVFPYLLGPVGGTQGASMKGACDRYLLWLIDVPFRPPPPFVLLAGGTGCFAVP